MQSVQPNSRIRRWDIVTIGNLSRNRYWGESDDRPVRPPLCTSTLIRGEDFRLLVDPPFADGQKMAAELDRRCGLKLGDVSLVFITHAHGDHQAGLGHFAAARWLAAGKVADAINAAAGLPRPLEDAQGRLPEGIELVASPGHTMDHHSLAFRCEGRWIVVAGDAVMTRDFWRDRQGFRNSVDFALASATIEKLTAMADVIVPGHDNYFPVRQ